jgi:hypothetical protein
LWGWNGGVPLVGVAVPITWEMHSSILHFKAWKKTHTINLLLITNRRVNNKYTFLNSVTSSTKYIFQYL